MNSLLPPSPPSGLQLTAILRPLESEGNLFVRLTPRTASQLASLLNSSPSISLSREVNFLPLEITINQQCKEHDDDAGRDGIVIYASYNGGAPTNLVHPSQPHYPSTNHDNIIDLPPNLHSSLVSIFNSTSEPVVVSVRPLEDIPVGEIVTFEPLTTSDWEMIEMEASVLEDGGLLNQITIVSTGQVFPLKFGGRLNNLDSAAWIKVVNIDHASCANDVSDEDSETSFASDSDYYSSVGSSVEGNNNIRSESNRCSRSGRCVRLMAETEVVVIPKPRIRREDPVQGDEKKSNGQLSNEEEEARVYCPSNALRVQPVGSHILHAISGIEGMPSLPNPRLGSVCIHPSTAMQLPGYSDINQIQRTLQYPDQEMLPFVVTIRKVDGPHAKYLPSYEADDGGETHSNVLVARIFTTNDAHPGHIGMHAFLCYQLGVSPLVDWVSVQIWSEYHVVNSINDTRDRIDGIDITKISTSATSENHSALYRNFPMNCSVTAPFSDLQSPCNPDMLFTSGTLVPSEFLQKLGCISLGQQHYVLRLQPIPNGIDSKDTSQLVPIITTRDLVKLLRVKTELEPISMEIKDVSAVLPLNGATFGFSSAIQDVVKSVTELMHTSDRGTSFVSKSMNKQAIMIVGEEGSGKSHLAMAASSKISLSKLCATVYLDCKKLQASSTNIQFILREIHIAFQEALHKQPSILVLDDLDSLIPNVGSSDTEVDGSTHQQQINPALISQVKIIVDHLLFQSQHCQEATRCGSPRVTLICTCRDINSLSGLYQESGIFHALIEVPSLDPSQRSQFLHSQLFRNMDVPPDNRVSRVFSRLGKATDGYRPKDLKVVATRILHLDCLRSFNGLKESGEELKTLELDIASVIEEYSPLCQKLVDIDPNLSSMDWEEIGGLYEVKQSLHDIILHPMKFKAVYENAPMDLPTGVLLYGPPGCGKSFIVPILAKAAKLNLITCKGPELLDRYIGASEAKVRQLFARASAAAPAMIFFDEFDSLAPQRGSDNTGVTDRVVNQLLTLLDGAERNKKAGHIFVVAATSRPDKVDKALLRPGRLEKHIYVGYPESISEWNSLLASLFKLRQTDEEVSRLEQSGDLFNSFCKDFSYARDFSAADVKAALDTAHLLSVHDIIDEDDGHEGPVVLEKRHILKAFEQTKPSLLPKDRQMLKSIYNSFGGKKTKDDSEYRSKVRQLKTSLR